MDDQTQRMYEVMKKESNRLKTFQMNPPWPKDYVDIKKLAKAGFFYAFNGDNVHCAFCRGQVCRWDRDDDPMAEHARHFTTCPFILGGEVGNEPIGDDPFPGPKRPRPYDVCGANPAYPPNDPRYLEEQQSIQEHVHDDQTQQQQHLQQQPRTQPEIRQVPASLHHRMAPRDHSEHNQHLHRYLNREEPLRHNPSTLQPIIHSQNESSNSNLRHSHNLVPSQGYALQQQTARSQLYSSEPAGNSNNNPTCKICYINMIDLIFLPCGHLVSCLSCAERLRDCPICRETITTRIRAYFS